MVAQPSEVLVCVRAGLAVLCTCVVIPDYTIIDFWPHTNTAMGAVESVQTTSFEFRLFGRTSSSDSVPNKPLKSASVCLEPVSFEKHSFAEPRKLRETASMPLLPSYVEQLREDEPRERKGLAAAFQRLAKLARVKRSQSRRHSSGDTHVGVARNRASAHKRPKSLPDLSCAEWPSEPHRLEIEWPGSEPHRLTETEPHVSTVEDEAVADYMYLTACPDTHNARVRSWWPRRLVPVQSMQFMPRLDELMDGWGTDYWDVLSRCPMRPTSSLALASLREMVEPESASLNSSDENRLPTRAKARQKRVLSEPMQYILYNSYLRYYGPPDKQ
ncbi:hypothetical protein GGH14_004625 [Coemansia sp. RSA 370]|nr:hypothetical protein GGH14_004625 [Coemansia sp. RSA 370]